MFIIPKNYLFSQDHKDFPTYFSSRRFFLPKGLRFTLIFLYKNTNCDSSFVHRSSVFQLPCVENTTNPPHNFHQSFLSECLILSLDSPFSFTALCMYASIITVACWLLYSASLKIRQCHSSNLVLIFFFFKNCVFPFLSFFL